MDRRLDMDPDLSRNRDVSGESPRDCAVDGLVSLDSELALSTTDGDLDGPRSFFTEKKVEDGLEPG
jgi:hypothetical protein